MSVDVTAATLVEEGGQPALHFSSPAARALGPVPTPTTNRLTGDKVTDPEMFFRTSQVADSLRDTAKLFLESQVDDAAALAQMVADYEALRTSLGTIVDASLAEGTERHCPALGEDASLALLVYATAQLCRWIDAIQATPAFLIAEQVKTANAHEVASKVTAVLGETSKAAAHPSAALGRNTGQYL